MKVISILLIAFGWLGMCSNSTAQTIFPSQHELLVQAIQNGEVEGIMHGEIAEHFSREFRSTGALLVHAMVIRDFKQDDCKRIETIFTKKDVATPNGLTDAFLKTQMNYCLDGSAPNNLE